MKKTIIAVAVIFFYALALAGQKPIPEAVMKAFSEREPGVSGPLWEYREGAFVAMYMHKDGLKKMFFNQEGAWLESRTRISREALPAEVRSFIDEHYADADITYIGVVDQPGPTLYRVESELTTSVVIKLLDQKGNLVKENRIDWSFIPD